jgi:Concanavalin A-like lectin/glucanases superfamily/Immunoglobulin I-set domain
MRRWRRGRSPFRIDMDHSNELQVRLSPWTAAMALLAILSLFGPASPCAQAGCVSPPGGLVGWWPGEGDATDRLGVNNGTTQGGVGYAPGETGQAFLFDGSSGYVTFAANSSLNAGLGGGMTIECWMKPGDLSRGSIVAEWNDGVGHVGMQLQISVPELGGLGSVFANILDTSGADHFIASAPGILTPNGFQHIAVTYDKTTGAATIYYNGVAAANQNFGAITPQTSYAFYLGARKSGPGTGEFYQGLLDEVSLYDRALSAAEIRAIYNAGTAGKCAGPSAPWIFSQPTDQTAVAGGSAVLTAWVSGTQPLAYQWRKNNADVAGATNDPLVLTNLQFSDAGAYLVVVTNSVGSVTSSVALLTVNPAPRCAPPPPGLSCWWPAEGDAKDRLQADDGTLQGGLGFAPGETGQAFSFDGVSGYAAFAASSRLNVALGSGVTIECWMKPGDLSRGSIVAEWNDGKGHVGMQLQISVPQLGGLGSIFANLLDTSGLDHFIASAPGILNSSVFQHVAVT